MRKTRVDTGGADKLPAMPRRPSAEALPAEQAPARTGRPAAFDREAAIAAAMNLFWERGYPAVSASDLADAMGIQRSSFYNSFGTREAVFLEALRHYAATAPDRPLDEITPDAPVLPVIVGVFRGLCRARAKDRQARGCLVCNAMGDLIGVDASLGPLIAGALGARIAGLEKLLARAVRQQELPPDTDCAALARSIVAQLIGLNTMSKVVRSERTLWLSAQHFLYAAGLLALQEDGPEAGR